MPTSRTPYDGTRRDLVVAIDFGTTCSGVSYAILEPGTIPEIRSVSGFEGQDEGSTKVPSQLHYDVKGNLHAIGSQIFTPERALQSQTEKWIEVAWLKLIFRPSDQTVPGADLPEVTIPNSKTPVVVLGDYLQYLMTATKAHIIRNEIGGENIWMSVEDRIVYILSYPNGWKDSQCEKLTEACLNGKLIPNASAAKERLRFISEGEASFHWCLENIEDLEGIPVGSDIIVADLGGGTIDVSSFRITSKDPVEVEEKRPPQGRSAGSISVNRAFRKYLQEKLPGFDRDTKTVDHLCNEFERNTKRAFGDPSRQYYIPLGAPSHQPELGVHSGTLVVSGLNIKGMFEISCRAATEAIKSQILPESPRTAVFLVGGFSASPWLFKELKRRLSGYPVLVDRAQRNETAKAVAEGAVVHYLDHVALKRVVKPVGESPATRDETRDPQPGSSSAPGGTLQRTITIPWAGRELIADGRLVKIALVLAPSDPIPEGDGIVNPETQVYFKVIEFGLSDIPPQQSFRWSSDFGFGTYEEINGALVSISSKYTKVPSGHYVNLTTPTLRLRSPWGKPQAYSKQSSSAAEKEKGTALAEDAATGSDSDAKMPDIFNPNASHTSNRLREVTKRLRRLRDSSSIAEFTAPSHLVGPVAVNRTKEPQKFTLGCIIKSDGDEEVFCPMILYEPTPAGYYVVGSSNFELRIYRIHDAEGNADLGPSQKGKKGHIVERGPVQPPGADLISGPFDMNTFSDLSFLDIQSVPLEHTTEAMPDVREREEEELRDRKEPARVPLGLRTVRIESDSDQKPRIGVQKTANPHPKIRQNPPDPDRISDRPIHFEDQLASGLPIRGLESYQRPIRIRNPRSGAADYSGGSDPMQPEPTLRDREGPSETFQSQHIADDPLPPPPPRPSSDTPPSAPLSRLSSPTPSLPEPSPPPSLPTPGSRPLAALSPPSPPSSPDPSTPPSLPRSASSSLSALSPLSTPALPLSPDALTPLSLPTPKSNPLSPLSSPLSPSSPMPSTPPSLPSPVSRPLSPLTPPFSPTLPEPGTPLSLQGPGRPQPQEG